MRDVADRAEQMRVRESGESRPIDLLSFETLAGQCVFVPAAEVDVDDQSGDLQAVHSGQWITTDLVIDPTEVA